MFKYTLQKLMAALFLAPLYIGVVVWFKLRGYRIRDLQRARDQYRRYRLASNAPLLICANHMTYVDSLFIAYALGDLSFYIKQFAAFPWNLPKKTNVKACWFYPFLCYIGKCLLLPSDIDKSRRVLQDTKDLLAKGETFLIFPEGTRSDNGIINVSEVSYGIGDLVSSLPADRLHVLLVYLRGDKEMSKSKYPEKDQSFEVELRLLDCSGEVGKGRRAHRAIAVKIAQGLKSMETRYFEHRK